MLKIFIDRMNLISCIETLRNDEFEYQLRKKICRVQFPRDFAITTYLLYRTNINNIELWDFSGGCETIIFINLKLAFVGDVTS